MYKNEWKGHKFRWQKNKKSDLYRNKKVTKINDIGVNKLLVSKEEPRFHLITSLDTMITMLLDHYV